MIKLIAMTSTRRGEKLPLLEINMATPLSRKKWLLKIRDLVVNQRKSHLLVASMFGVSRHVVGKIVRGESSGHVDGPRQIQERIKQSWFKGVRLSRGQWEAYARANGKHVYLGLFNSEEDAAIARNNFDISQGSPPSNVIPATETVE
jgi:hypothetical protein